MREGFEGKMWGRDRRKKTLKITRSEDVSKENLRAIVVGVGVNQNK